MKKWLALFLLAFGLAGCTGINAVDQKINQVKEAAESEVKAKLQAAIQQQVDQLKVSNPQFATMLKQKDSLQAGWEALKNTELAERSFFSVFGYEYLAKVRGDGTVQVVQRNTGTGEEKVFGEYKILLDGDGQVQIR